MGASWEIAYVFQRKIRFSLLVKRACASDAGWSAYRER